MYFLHRYRAPTDWTRKEGLFYALVAAHTADNNDLPLVILVAEAYAANQQYDDAIRVTQDALKRLDFTNAPERRSELLRSIAAIQRQREQAGKKADDAKPK